MAVNGQTGFSDAVNPTEAVKQEALFRWAVLQPPESGIRLMMHIPNGGYRKPSEAARFRALCVRAGVPDIFLPVARGGYHGLWIELNRRRGGRVSGEQAGWIDVLKKQCYVCAVCHGCEAAVAVIYGYMRGYGACGLRKAGMT